MFFFAYVDVINYFSGFTPVGQPAHLKPCKNQPVAIAIEETEDHCTRGVQREHLSLSTEISIPPLSQ